MSDESTALATREPATAGALVAAPMFTPEQERMIREMYAPTSSDLEFEVLLSIARSLGLNPLRGQIHFVKRRTKEDGGGWVEKWTHQVSIDGFRSMAEDTGEYDGQDEPEFEWEPGAPFPDVARVRVYRKNIGRPFVGVARWEEFVQVTREGDPTRMWKQMGSIMLAKCAEAQGLRKAFPKKLGKLYTPEEMGQAENPPKPWRVVAATDPGQHTGHKAKLPPAKPPTAEEISAMGAAGCEDVIRKAAKLPGVRAAAYSRLIALAGGRTDLDKVGQRIMADAPLSEDLKSKLLERLDLRAAALEDSPSAHVADDLDDRRGERQMGEEG